MNLSTLLILSGAIASFCTAAYLFVAALDEARPMFPPALQDHETSRYAIDTLIWQASIPARTRLKYFLSLVCASAAAGFIALLMAFHGSMPSAVLFGVVFLFMAAATLTRWSKHRALL